MRIVRESGHDLLRVLKSWLARGAGLAATTTAIGCFVFFSLSPARARAAEQAIPFHGQNSAIFVEGDPLIHWIGEPTEIDSELFLSCATFALQSCERHFRNVPFRYSERQTYRGVVLVAAEKASTR